jgi:hypothetical protein
MLVLLALFAGYWVLVTVLVAGFPPHGRNQLRYYKAM